jgi:hypothetical protein
MRGIVILMAGALSSKIVDWIARNASGVIKSFSLET